MSSHACYTPGASKHIFYHKMRYSFCSVLLLFVVFFQRVISCKNFLTQHCIDTSTGLKSIATTQCIQLVPTQFNSSIDYSVENYIIKKSTTCYNVVSLDSPSINLFSNTCQELCPEEYCKLFDNQSNTSIINIFYSPSLTYEIITSLTYDIFSYDYLLFDSCSADNKINKTLLIVVYILSAIVVIFAIAVILKFVLPHCLKKGPYDPYSLYWILDCLFCQIKERKEPPDDSSDDSNPSVENSQPRSNQIQRKDLGSPSTPTHIPFHGNSNSTNNQLNVSSNSSSYNQHYHDLSSVDNTPNPVRRNNIKLTDTEYDSEIKSPPIESENHHRLPILYPLVHKISNEIRAALSINSTTSKYESLEGKKSASIINFRL